jgi:hypothetical protein
MPHTTRSSPGQGGSPDAHTLAGKLNVSPAEIEAAIGLIRTGDSHLIDRVIQREISLEQALLLLRSAAKEQP